MTRLRPQVVAAALAVALAAAAAARGAPDVQTQATDAATDLVVTQSGSSDELLVGQTLTLTVTVTNNGPDPASKVTVREALSGAKATIAAATPSAGQPCSIGTTARSARCVVGTLASGQQAQVTVAVTVTASGTLSSTASADGNQHDPQPTNSQATTQTRVRETDPPVDATLTGDALTLPVVSSSDFRLSWKAVDTGSGIAGYDIRYRAAQWSGAFGPYVAWQTNSSDTHGIFLGKPGWSYCFQLRAADRDGNGTDWTPERCASVPLAPQSMTRSSGWTVGATSVRAQERGASLLVPQVIAKRIYVSVVRCPGCGTLSVLWSGRPVATLRLDARDRSRALIPVASWPSVRRGALRLSVASTRGSVTVAGLGIVKR